jgi:hypothetical protein|tara:strand:- start:674 stop:1048 length:375 start_codon:yes stop_codon:yes gene_type:complete
MCEEYNGWTNRETWLVDVHNVFELGEVRDAIEDMVTRPPEHTVIASTPDLGGVCKAYLLQLEDWLQETHQEFMNDQMTWNAEDLSAYIIDLIADHKIDWRDIARHYEDDIRQALKERDMGTILS